MNMNKKSFFSAAIFIIMIFVSACISQGKEKETLVLLQTNMGDIKLKLYNETPGHRDKFIKLVKSGFYDSILFHRVIDSFMIQAGDPSTKMEMTKENIARYDYTIPAEINDSLFHKKGVLAAARQGDQFNPERASSGTQFYIVEGRPFNDEELDNIEKRIDATLKQGIFYKYLVAERKRVAEAGENKSAAEIQEFASIVAMDEIDDMKPYKIPEERREVYRTIGGTPHLDKQYTVFGEVVSGQEIVDAIAAAKTDGRDKPVKDIMILKAKIVRK
jgi:peptidylprolyl isomerase